MRASLGLLVVSFWLGHWEVCSAENSFESPESNLSVWSLGTIFASTPAKSDLGLEESSTKLDDADNFESKKEFRLPMEKRKYRIPKDWEAFEREFAPKRHVNQPQLQLLENGMYQVNQTLYAFELFESKVNALMNLEYSLRELKGYDKRTRANRLDDFFDHARVKTEFDWDAPVSLYIGVRFQIRCDSIFQFWK